MADDDTDVPAATIPYRQRIRMPRSMRPRSTANAEINAQEADKVRRDMGVGYPLAPNQSYAQGGPVPPKGTQKASILPKHATTPFGYCAGGKVIKSTKF